MGFFRLEHIHILGPNVHPSIHLFRFQISLSFHRVKQGWSRPQYALDKRQVTPCKGYQSVTGLGHTDKQPFTTVVQHLTVGNLESSVHRLEETGVPWRFVNFFELVEFEDLCDGLATFTIISLKLVGIESE